MHIDPSGLIGNTAAAVTRISPRQHPGQVQAASSAAPRHESLFDQYAHRIKALVPFLNDTDKEMLGGLYALAAKQGEQALKKVDELAKDLAMQRLMERDAQRHADAEEKSRRDALEKMTSRNTARSATPPNSVQFTASSVAQGNTLSPDPHQKDSTPGRVDRLL
ncbi:hypothetical protein KEM60_02912 [Austwickia sp. TVS 96-490-7B]|uniref:hypothetical protein n=1 Tax=Austwickia sp. TVS 96-490-7B TaxID=2830843 RepID=UPI001C5A14FD|nr:hypothetical protein [Austwickia sp. TVS 96-490-7B]MBW3086683.1 hypothetical protein [Austwickia sp. TVS 96-490-7B]